MAKIYNKGQKISIPAKSKNYKKSTISTNNNKVLANIVINTLTASTHSLINGINTVPSSEKRVKVQAKSIVFKKGNTLPLDSPIEKQIKNLGIKIKQLRLKMGFTNADFFAYEHRISRSQYGRYERGEDLRFSSLLRLLEIHQISLKEFFSEGFND